MMSKGLAGPLWCGLILIGFTCALCGCTSGVGSEVNKVAVDQLRVGRTTQDDSRRMLGKPLRTQTVTTGGSTFVVDHYSYSESQLGAVKARSVNVECRDGLVNGYAYASSFDFDKTQAPMAAVASVKERQSTRQDVERLLGLPSGRVRIPTSFRDVSEIARGTGGVELWFWFSMDKITWSTNDQTVRMIYVVFDASDVVVKTLTREEAKPVYN